MLMENGELMTSTTALFEKFKFKAFHGFLTSYCYHQSSIKERAAFKSSSFNKIKFN